MIKQQLFRLDERGSRTVASSPGMKNSAWLHLLEQQLELMLPELEQLPMVQISFAQQLPKQLVLKLLLLLVFP